MRTNKPSNLIMILSLVMCDRHCTLIDHKYSIGFLNAKETKQDLI